MNLPKLSLHVLFCSSINSLDPRITLRVKEVGDLLLSLKGGAQVALNQPAARSQIAADADDVLLPLMDLLDGTFFFKYLFGNAYSNK